MPSDSLTYPLISIITIVKNNASTIERAIKSLITQKNARYEYIVIDGASTDGTVDIIRKYDKFISYWISEKDSGSAEAFNKGFEQVHGDLVGFLMADDWLEPNALHAVSDEYRKIVTAFNKDELKEKYKEIGIICGAMNIVYSDGRQEHWDTDEINIDEFPLHHAISSVATFYSPEVQRKIGGWNNDYKIANDYDFFLRCYYNHVKFHIINQTIINFSFGNGASTKNELNTNIEAYHVAVGNGKIYNPYFVPTIKRYYNSLFKWLVLKEGFKNLNSEVDECNQGAIRRMKLYFDNEKPIVIFGWGKNGKKIAEMLSNVGIDIYGVTDNSRDIKGLGHYNYIDVGSLESKNYFVIITPIYHSLDISDQLRNMGLRKSLDYITIFDLAVLGMN